MKKIVNVMRWIGLALLPLPLAALLQAVINLIAISAIRIAIDNEDVAYWGANVVSGIPMGCMIPFFAGVIAPRGKALSAVIVSSASSVIMLMAIILAVIQAQYLTAIIAVISMVACICMTVYVYVVTAGKKERTGSDVIDIDNGEVAKPKISATIATAATGAVQIALFVGFLLLKLVGWFVALLILGFLVRLGWGLMGHGVFKSIIGFLLFGASAPSLFGSVVQMFIICVTAVPILANAIFSDD